MSDTSKLGAHTPGRVSTESQRQVHCNGHHDCMRGIPRSDAPLTLREYWLDGWDSADGELYNRVVTHLNSRWKKSGVTA